MRYLAISIMLHLLLLGFLMNHQDKARSKSNQSTADQAEQPKKVSRIRLKIDTTEKPKPKKKKINAKSVVKEPIKEAPCEKFYYGIGYMGSVLADSEGRCSITDIALNGPLHRAGVVAGDTIESIDGKFCPGRGPDESLITVTVYHQDSARVLLLQREKICED